MAAHQIPYHNTVGMDSDIFITEDYITSPISNDINDNNKGTPKGKTNSSSSADKKHQESRKGVKMLLKFHDSKEPDVTKETPENVALKRLKSRLYHHMSHPLYQGVAPLPDLDLLSWLRSCDLNIFLTEAKLLHHMKTRRAMGLDCILTDYKPLDLLRLHYTGGLCGDDREGCPIWYELIGSMDMGNLIRSLQRDELVKFKFYQMEMLRDAAKKNGVTQILVIVDTRGMASDALGPAADVWTMFLETLQDHYPYLVKEIILLNRSAFFPRFAAAMRPHLNRLTRSKVTILGCSNILKYLLCRVEKFNIPAVMGGYKCDIDNNPTCRQDLRWNGKIPPWMRLTNPRLEANVRPFTILGGQRLAVDIHVGCPGSRFLLDFLQLNQPITASLYWDTVKEKNCIVHSKPVAKITTLCRVAAILLEKAGRYVAVLDNCKNFAQPARGLYQFTVSPPDGLTSKLAPQKPLGDKYPMEEPMRKEEAFMLSRTFPGGRKSSLRPYFNIAPAKKDQPGRLRVMTPS